MPQNSVEIKIWKVIVKISLPPQVRNPADSSANFNLELLGLAMAKGNLNLIITVYGILDIKQNTEAFFLTDQIWNSVTLKQPFISNTTHSVHSLPELHSAPSINFNHHNFCSLSSSSKMTTISFLVWYSYL